LPAVEFIVPILTEIASVVGTIHKFISKLPGDLKLAAGGALLFVGAMAGVLGSRGIGKMVGGVGGIFGKMAGGVGKGMGSMTGAVLSPIKSFVNTIQPGKLLAAGAALIMIAGALWITADALKKMQGLDWKTLGQAGAALGSLIVAVIALGMIMTSGIGTIAILGGAAAMLIMGGALWVVADAMEKMAASAGGLERLFGTLMMIDPAKLIAVGASFGAIGAGMTAMAIGGAASGIVNTIFGNLSGPAAGKEDKTDIVIEKLDKLIEVLEDKNFSINMDGRRVSKQLGVATQYGT